MTAADNNNIRYVLWTGGFDSTFMILKYAREEFIIQPVYVIDPERRSTQYELNAMKAIIKLLETKYAADIKAEIRPVRIIEMKDIPPDARITSYYNDLSERIKIGSQYEWLSRLATMFPFLDIGVEKHIDAFGGCSSAIKNDGGFIDYNGIGQLNVLKSSEQTIALFGKFRFPIYQYTGTEMLALVHAWGWDEIIQKSWFCHNPILNLPCGMCRPCQQKMEDCLDFLLPKGAQKRYKLYIKTKALAGERVAEKMSEVYRHLWIKGH